MRRPQVWHTNGGGLLTREGIDVVIIIQHCRVGSGVVGVVILAFIQGKSSKPVVRGCPRAQPAINARALMCLEGRLASLLLFLEAGQFEPHVSCVGMSACCDVRCCMVHVTAGCGRPSAVKTDGR